MISIVKIISYLSILTIFILYVHTDFIQEYDKYRFIDKQIFIRSKKHRCLNYFTDIQRTKTDINKDYKFYIYMKKRCHEFNYDIFNAIAERNKILFENIVKISIMSFITMISIIYACFT